MTVEGKHISRAVSASGSMWFPDFKEYAERNDFCRKPDKVYFSRGRG